MIGIYLGAFYNASPKIRGPPLKKIQLQQNLGRFYTQLPTIANISGKGQDIRNQRDV